MQVMGEFPPYGSRVIAQSGGLKRITGLSALLNNATVVFGSPASVEQSDLVIAWGERPSAHAAGVYARRHGLRLCFVEDGLIRSVGLGSTDPPLSLMVDDLAIYLDAHRQTRLEKCIQIPLSLLERERTHRLIELWRQQRVSKYNHEREYDAVPTEPYVLVIDQTCGDASITKGMADARSFDVMLDSAFKENPQCRIVLKVHPDVVTGRKQGHFDLRALAGRARLTIVGEGVHPCGLIQHAKCVYVVTSQVGFEALLWGRPVRTFGMPFYASWGVTQDSLASLPRRHPVSVDQLIFGTLVRYARYVDPECGKPCEIERVIGWVGYQRAQRSRFDRHVQAFGFSKWKKPFVRDFFSGSQVRFTGSTRRLSSNLQTAVWGRKHDAVLSKDGSRVINDVIRIEDGFLRSVGLGADLIRPLSWVQDDIGIYYDATCPSGLERILADYNFDDALLDRAAQLRARILASGLTKYNVGSYSSWSRPDTRKPILLVPGQVESDASIRYGAASIRTNLHLIKAVRRAHPDAFIIYKPHPDVLAKLRDQGDSEREARAYCDEIVGDVSMNLLLAEVDQIHTMTSLTGFEALLRNKRVFTYGQPFYAGWGLTTDCGMTEHVRVRRSRLLALDALVAATLILYPTYVSRHTHRYTTPERALEELIAWRDEARPLSRMRRWIAYLTRKL